MKSCSEEDQTQRELLQPTQTFRSDEVLLAHCLCRQTRFRYKLLEDRSMPASSQDALANEATRVDVT